MPDITFELDLPPGLNSDDTTFAAKGRYADASNVRFRNGKPESIGRIVRVLEDGTAPSPRSMFAYFDDVNQVPIVAVGSAGALWTSGSGAISLGDRSPVGLGANINSWALDSWGNTLLAAPLGGTLYEQSGSSAATEVTQAPDKMNHMLVTDERQVMALGCNEESSSTFNQMCVRWCDTENYSDWTTTSTNNAGEHILDGEGKIIAGRKVGSGNYAIWTNSGLYLAQFIGDPSQTFRFDLVDGKSGLVGPGAVALLGGYAYWMTPDHRFCRWAPGTVVETLPCPISRDLQENITRGVTRVDQRTNAAAWSAFGEVWWFYPDSRESNGKYRYVSLCTLDGSWSCGILDRRAAFESGFLFNPVASPSWRSWTSFISVDGDGKVYAHNVAVDDGGSAEQIAWHLQTADQYIESGQRRVMLSSFIPDFEAQTQDISLTVFVRDRPRSTPVTKGPYTIATAATKKDFRASGMLISVKFSGTGVGSNDGSWRIGKPVFRGVTMGER